VYPSSDEAGGAGALAKRCGNLNGEQLARLLAYKVAVEKALDAICLFYHCKKYHSSYSPIRVVFDRTGRANNREELVFKETMFVWITKNVMTSIKQIHTELASPTGTATTHSVVWLDRSGKKLSVVAPGQDSFDLRLSPDGQRLAYSKGGPNSDIWIQELKRDVPMRVTFDTSVDKGAPTWSPDGNEIAGQTRPSIRNLLDLPNSRLVRSSTVPQIPIVPVGRNWETEPKRLPFGAVGRNQILSTW
jgi:Tol biopolymer transport system component